MTEATPAYVKPGNDHVSEPFRALLATVSPGAVNTLADVYARIRADARADALDEAAKVADLVQGDNDHFADERGSVVAEQISGMIRALKEPK